MIFYFHGFSSGVKSHKAGVIKEYFNQFSIFVPGYTSHQPRNSITFLENYINEHLDANPAERIMLMGSSLGGYYAQYLATKIRAVAAVVLINPCLEPTVTLASQVGERVNNVTNMPFRFTQKDLEEFPQYDISLESLFCPTLVLLDEGDELIDYQVASDKYQGKGRVIVYPDGDHWFRHLDDALPEIKSFYNLYVQQKKLA